VVSHTNNAFIAGSSGRFIIDNRSLRQLRGTPWRKIDLRFFLLALLSILIHSALIYYTNKLEVKKVEVVIEEIPERFARLIIEKPIPKTEKKATGPAAGPTDTKVETEQKSSEVKSSAPVNRAQAQKAVQARTARVEEKVRTVGVLGMLTGVGTTAKGPSVVDVLGSMKDRKEKFTDLDAALANMSGLQKTQEVDVLNRKLVKSKDLVVSHKQEIDDLIANVGGAKTMELAKKGEFLIQRPESIEGAASSDAKRDSDVINSVVASHKTSIRMSYEKYLKRDPSLSGKITVRFTISASGSVTMVKVIENTTGNTELENEIIRKIKMWQFEPIAEGDVTVSYPFVFMTAG